jgi:hypothetical protein
VEVNVRDEIRADFPLAAIIQRWTADNRRSRSLRALT